MSAVDMPGEQLQDSKNPSCCGGTVSRLSSVTLACYAATMDDSERFCDY